FSSERSLTKARAVELVRRASFASSRGRRARDQGARARSDRRWALSRACLSFALEHYPVFPTGERFPEHALTNYLLLLGSIIQQVYWISRGLMFHLDTARHPFNHVGAERVCQQSHHGTGGRFVVSRVHKK